MVVLDNRFDKIEPEPIINPENLNPAPQAKSPCCLKLTGEYKLKLLVSKRGAKVTEFIILLLFGIFFLINDKWVCKLIYSLFFIL